MRRTYHVRKVSGRPTSVPPPSAVKVIVMKRGENFLYPDWMGYVSLPLQREDDHTVVYTPPFRPSKPIKRPETWLYPLPQPNHCPVDSYRLQTWDLGATGGFLAVTSTPRHGVLTRS
ncbi:hypothetical protein RRG08_003802 [Elysia crispata]|uniref:Uncharacterized protein n=1 Tax=Elysia crispata TaxID=231223 RepID=A0AAE1AVX2_9GAST|nr:hypothetical protein RRG08_003802 [Elysia crispata]